jgi:hypothetical protein
VPKISKPVLYVLIFAVGAFAYVYTSPETTKGKSTKTTRKTTTTKKAAAYTEEDMKAERFEPVNDPVRNAFKPLIVRKNTGGVGVDPNSGGIPAFLTDGDPNWVYTGSAEVNGSAQALLENKSTGEGVFLTEGQRWKRATVLDIGSDMLTFQGPAGEVQTIMLQTNEPQDFAPAGVGSPLSGPIGGLTVQPESAPATETRERLRRRNRNGGNNATD